MEQAAEETVIGVTEESGIPIFGLVKVNSAENREKRRKCLMRLYIQRFYIGKSLELNPNWKNF